MMMEQRYGASKKNRRTDRMDEQGIIMQIEKEAAEAASGKFRST